MAILKRVKRSFELRVGFNSAAMAHLDLPSISTAKQTRAEQQRVAERQRGQGKVARGTYVRSVLLVYKALDDLG